MPKGSDAVATFLDDRGVTCVFELIGGMIVHLLDSISQAKRIEIVSMHHEQGAAFAADGHARMTGMPGVAMATSGPGAINLLTGIASCYFDSTPAVFITGQVNRSELKGGRAVRQLGFQETDIVSVAAPITKAAWRVDEPEQLIPLLERSFDLASAGRPGPVLIDIPMDIQRADVPDVERKRPQAPRAERTFDDDAMTELLRALKASERPLVLLGGGVRSSSTSRDVLELVETLGIPAVNSLMAVDALPYAHPLRFGMIGSYGNRWANLAVGEADLLLVLGSRLDIRQTGSDTEAFKANRAIFQVDCEPGEINNRITGCRAIVSHLRPFLDEFLPIARSEAFRPRTKWLDALRHLRQRWPDTDELAGTPGINPNVLMHQLSAASSDAAAYIADVGQHQMWAAQSLELLAGQRFMTSGGLGSMGFGLPASIGAAFAARGRPIVLVAGDGGFQTNIQELQTVARNHLPIRMVIINNQTHGMVRQFQQTYFDSRYQSTVWGYSAPKFASVASAYGIPSMAVEAPAQVQGALDWMSDESGPALLEVMVSRDTNAYPKIAFGRPMTEMEPLATPVGIEGT